MQTKIIAGPCVIESAELLDTVARKLVDINDRLAVDIIFKASFDKANRTSISSFRGPGIDKGLQMLSDIKSRYGLKILTDIHESWQAEPTGEVVACRNKNRYYLCLWIPLCRPYRAFTTDNSRKMWAYEGCFG